MDVMFELFQAEPSIPSRSSGSSVDPVEILARSAVSVLGRSVVKFACSTPALIQGPSARLRSLNGAQIGDERRRIIAREAKGRHVGMPRCKVLS